MATVILALGVLICAVVATALYWDPFDYFLVRIPTGVAAEIVVDCLCAIPLLCLAIFLGWKLLPLWTVIYALARFAASGKPNSGV